MRHDWVDSTLGHGESMCRRCFITNREAAALGEHECNPPAPKAANENRVWSQDEIEGEMDRDLDQEDGIEPGEECGRWANGRLTHSCSKAGSEECDFECPHRSSLRF